MVKDYSHVLSKDVLHRTKSTTLLFGNSSIVSRNSSVDPEADPLLQKGIRKRANPISIYPALDKKPPIPKNKLPVNRTLLKQNQNSIVHSNRSKSVGRQRIGLKSGEKTQNINEDKFEVIELFRRKPNRKPQAREQNILLRENSLPNLASIQNIRGNELKNDNYDLSSKNSSHTSLKDYYHRVESQHRLRSEINNTRCNTPDRRVLNSTISREQFHFFPAKQKETTDLKSTVCQTTDLVTVNTNKPSPQSTKHMTFGQPDSLRRFHGNSYSHESQEVPVPNHRSIGTDPDPPNLDFIMKMDAELNRPLSKSFRTPSRGASLLIRCEKPYSIYHESILQTARSRSRGLGTSTKGNQQSRYLTDLEWRIGYGLNIYVFRNGIANESPLMIHIPPNRRKDMASVFGVISERIKYPVGYIFALYQIDGVQVFDPAELEMNHYYVVTSNLDKQFKSVQYGKRRLPLTYLSKSTKHVWGQNLNQDLNWCFKKNHGERNEEEFPNSFGIPSRGRHCARYEIETTEHVTRNLDWKTKYDINRNYEILENIIPPPTAFAD